MKIQYNSLFIKSIEDENKFYYSKFKKGLNIIQGDNRVGKSTIAKSIFYSLGADIDLDLENSESSVKDVITILELEINDNLFYLCNKTEDNQQFTYFLDQDYKLIVKGQKHKSNITETEILKGYASFSKIVLEKINKFDWIKFKNKYNNEQLINLYLSSFFEFFYVDQSEWGRDFVNFKDTEYIDKNALPLLISIFFNKINKEDFKLLDNSNKYNREQKEIELQKRGYENLIKKMNNDNNTPNPTIDNSKDFKQFFTFSNKQYENLIKLKKLYFQKVMLDKIQKQVKMNVKNMEYIKNEIFPVETSFVNSMGEKITLNFDDIISFKSNIKNNKIHQNELTTKLTSIDSQIKIIEKELKYLTNRSDENFVDKFRKMTLKSINENDLAKIFKINKSIGVEIENLDLKLKDLKLKISDINEKWENLKYKNNIFLKELTGKLNDKFNNFGQKKEIRYFLNQNNFSGNRLTGSDQIFFSILQKMVFYEEIENQSINFKIPLVIDTPNKEDLSERNWEKMSNIIDTISSKTQLIVMTTKKIDSKVTFNNIDLSSKKPRELLKNNNISQVPDKISKLSQILLEI